MNVALAFVLAGSTGTAALLSHLLLHRRPSARSPGSGSPLPAPVRWLAQVSWPWSSVIAARLPVRTERSLLASLARAGLHQDLGPSQWVGVLAASLLAALLTSTLAAAIGFGSGLFGFGAALLPPLLLQAWLRQRASERTVALLKELPTLLELLVLCLEAGASLGTALRISGEKSASGPLRELLLQILQRMRSGQPRAVALQGTLGTLDLDATTALATALVQAETSGMSLGPVLRSQGEQVMTARFVRAEKAAMQAPVKLLLPLLACIFPCTFIVIAIPIAARLTGISGE